MRRLRACGYLVCRQIPQDGTSEDDSITDTAVRDDGIIILGGDTAGNWTGSNAGGKDFAVVALDADGKEIWRWQVT